jgi:hypothetical protein
MFPCVHGHRRRLCQMSMQSEIHPRSASPDTISADLSRAVEGISCVDSLELQAGTIRPVGGTPTGRMAWRGSLSRNSPRRCASWNWRCWRPGSSSSPRTSRRSPAGVLGLKADTPEQVRLRPMLVDAPHHKEPTLVDMRVSRQELAMPRSLQQDQVPRDPSANAISRDSPCTRRRGAASSVPSKAPRGGPWRIASGLRGRSAAPR